MSIEEILREVDRHETRLVELTGGEPLEQEEVYPLLSRLADSGREVLVETGGHVPIARVDPRAVVVLDVKAPGSGMERANCEENLEALRPRDEVKIVVADRRDFDWALALVRRRDLDRLHTVTFSPAWGVLEPGPLAEWVLESRRTIRLGLPIHKLLWGETPGR
jgi:7-carboxy-7-deazaguanine synthase